MIIAVMAVLGLCAGSFVNALVWRIHEQSKAKKPPKQLSIAHGRSMCVHCKHQLVWYDLIPVFSWLALKGKCRYCHKPISVQYPLVELLTASLFVWSYLVWARPTTGWQALALLSWLSVLTGLIALLIYDLKWMLLPNRILFPLYIPGVIYAVSVVLAANNHSNTLLQMVYGSVFLGGLFWVLFQLSKGKWIGGGDVKLGFLVGLLAGSFLGSIILLFIASMLGTFIALPLLAIRRAKGNTRVAFGPLLIIGTCIVVLYGPNIIHWYNRVFLLTY